MNSLDSLKIVRWKTGQSFVSGNWFFLGFSGISGVESAFGTWAKKTRASGLNGHGKRGNAERERREMNPFFGNPRILFIGRQVCLGTRGVRSYALRTRTSCMTEASTASVRMGRVLGFSGRMGRVAGEVGRMGRRVGWDVGSDGSDGSASSDMATWTIRGQSSRLRGAYRSTQRVLRRRTLTPLRIISEFWIK